MPVGAEVPILLAPGIVRLDEVHATALLVDEAVDPLAHHECGVHVTPHGVLPGPLHHGLGLAGADDHLLDAVAVLVGLVGQPLRHVLEDAVVSRAIVGLEHESVVRVEETCGLSADLLADPGDVEARGPFDVQPDHHVVDVDGATV